MTLERIETQIIVRTNKIFFTDIINFTDFEYRQDEKTRRIWFEPKLATNNVTSEDYAHNFHAIEYIFVTISPISKAYPLRELKYSKGKVSVNDIERSMSVQLYMSEEDIERIIADYTLTTQLHTNTHEFTMELSFITEAYTNQNKSYGEYYYDDIRFLSDWQHYRAIPKQYYSGFATTQNINQEVEPNLPNDGELPLAGIQERLENIMYKVSNISSSSSKIDGLLQWTIIILGIISAMIGYGIFWK